ncbi:SMR family transporter [Hymenobacter sp. M29]|uniref:Guanidinium exporter n=1 Tax=Hymenobacter mellowenesis TaxID=3063995 RepID=A0ABT9A6R4_9BACT|nr:SMR family transporter [Hymenobacter sp. M29]MDO7845543.1 SMR family transporter [Hymenobacter sp. M29]
MLNPWFSLFLASFMEVCWTYSLKALSMQRIKEIAWAHSLGQPALLLPVLPLLAYVGFGLANVYFLSLAMKDIPTATAYSAWMALAVVGIKLVDTFYLKQALSWQSIFFTSLIIIGVLGLRRVE